jgi:hypothetical protein
MEDEMKTVISHLQSRTDVQVVHGLTARPSGVFDTSARLDAQAAQMRNITVVSGHIVQSWDINHSGTPPMLPDEVSDQPDQPESIGLSAVD